MSMLDEIRARCEAATPGPWEADALGQYVWQKENITRGAMIAEMRGWGYLTGMGGGLSLSDDEAIAIQTANTKFIAHAREDIPYLLEENERLTAGLEKYHNAERDAQSQTLKDIKSEFNCRHAAGIENIEIKYRTSEAFLTLATTIMVRVKQGCPRCGGQDHLVPYSYCEQHFTTRLNEVSGDEQEPTP